MTNNISENPREQHPDIPQFAREKRGATLKDSCVLIMGQSPLSNTYNTSGDGLPFYQGNADFGEENPVPRSWCTEPKKITEKGDILISARAPIGTINIADEKCCIGRGVAAIRPNQEVMSTAFFQHQLFASRSKLEAMGTGSTFKAIGKKTLSDFPVVTYPMNIQEAIAQQLSLIKKQIKTANSRLDRLDSLVKSRFVEMFGDPNTCTTANTIEDAFYIRDDLRKPLSGKERAALRDGQLYPYYGANGQVDSINAYLTDCDALCFAEDCGSYGSDENTAYIIRGKAWVNNHAHLLIPKYQNFLEYARIFYLLLDVNRYISGTTRAKLTQAQLKRICIHIPSEKQLAEFTDFVSQVDKLRFETQQQIEKLETLKKSLMQEYFG